MMDGEKVAEPLGGPLSDDFLKGFDSYVFFFRVCVDVEDLEKGAIQSLRGALPGQMMLLDIHLLLRLLGLKYLAYLFEFPKPEPWDDVSKAIVELSYAHADCYAFDGAVLRIPEVVGEVRRLREWLRANGYNSPEFRELGEKVLGIVDRRARLLGEHAGREMEPPDRELGELCRSYYEDLEGLADLLGVLAEAIELDQISPPIVELRRD